MASTQTTKPSHAPYVQWDSIVPLTQTIPSGALRVFPLQVQERTDVSLAWWINTSTQQQTSASILLLATTPTHLLWYKRNAATVSIVIQLRLFGTAHTTAKKLPDILWHLRIVTNTRMRAPVEVFAWKTALLRQLTIKFHVHQATMAMETPLRPSWHTHVAYVPQVAIVLEVISNR